LTCLHTTRNATVTKHPSLILHHITFFFTQPQNTHTKVTSFLRVVKKVSKTSDRKNSLEEALQCGQRREGHGSIFNSTAWTFLRVYSGLHAERERERLCRSHHQLVLRSPVKCLCCQQECIVASCQVSLPLITGNTASFLFLFFTSITVIIFQPAVSVLVSLSNK
jgi:hypothetical protein